MPTFGPATTKQKTQLGVGLALAGAIAILALGYGAVRLTSKRSIFQCPSSPPLAEGPLSLTDAGDLASDVLPRLDATNRHLTRLLLEARATGWPRDEAARSTLQQLAAERKTLLVEAVRKTPADVSAAILPDSLRAVLAAHTRNCAEEPISLEGQLVAHHADRESGSQTAFALRTASGLTRLHVVESTAARAPGQQVRVTGLRLTETEVLVSGTLTAAAPVAALGGIDPVVETASVIPVDPVLGEQRILVSLIHESSTSPVSGMTWDQYAPPANFEPYFFTGPNSLNEWFREMSYGKVSLAGTVSGWHQLPAGIPCGDLVNVQNAAAQAAIDADPTLVLGDFAALNIVSDCVSIPATSFSQQITTTQGTVTLDVTWTTDLLGGTAGGASHELGHAIGNTMHANYLDCGPDTLAFTCTAVEYGDFYDIMGGQSQFHFNALKKLPPDWFEPSNVITVTDRGPTVYELSPYELPGPEPKVLQVVTGADAVLTVEYRQPIGYDSTTRPGSDVYSGALIHYRDLTHYPSSWSGSLLLDLSPPASDAQLVTLHVGESFTHPTTGATIRVLDLVPVGGAELAKLSVEVTLGDDTLPPTVAITAPPSGVTVNGTITVDVTAADVVGIARVELWTHNGLLPRPRLLDTQTAPPYTFSLDTATILPNGTNYLLARAYDPSGNGATSLPYTQVLVANVDATPPVNARIISPAGGASVVVNSTVTGSAEDDHGLWSMEFVFDRGTAQESRRFDYLTPFTVPLQLATGSHTITPIARDLVGNVSQPGPTITVTVLPDTTPPAIQILAPSEGEPVDAAFPLIVHATDDGSLRYLRFYEGASITPFRTVVVDGASVDQTIEAVPRAPDGPVAFRVNAEDWGGNVASATVNVTVDRVAPTVNLTFPTGTVRSALTLRARAADALGIQRMDFFRDNFFLLGTSSTCHVAAGGACDFWLPWDSRTVTDGDHVLYVKAVDQAGNGSYSPNTTVTVLNAVKPKPVELE